MTIRRMLGVFSLFLVAACASAQNVRMVRSTSGPSGKVSGVKFIFDEVRNRFVFPQDKSLTVFFEFNASVGSHAMSAIWKDPTGKPFSLSQDVRIDTTTPELNGYWIFDIAAHMPAGIWTVEIRVDGAPAGSHVFELVTPPPPAPAPVTEAAPVQPSLDQIFRTVQPSLVWVYKLDDIGRRIDTSSGFVYAPGQILTAFQAIDGAAAVEVEFADTRRAKVIELPGRSRMGDWALLAADTGAVKPVERGEESSIVIGERLIVFNVEGTARVIGGVDISGRNDNAPFGPRIQFAQSPTLGAVGGPLLDLFGKVVGLVGGSVTPGSRISAPTMSINSGIYVMGNTVAGAIPLSMAKAGTPVSFGALLASGELTPTLVEMTEIKYGSATSNLPRNAADTYPPNESEFSRRTPQVNVFVMVKREGKGRKGMLSAKVYDMENHVRLDVLPKQMTIPTELTRLSFGFSPANLAPGMYRIDMLWDSVPVWRTTIRVSE